MSYIDSMEIIQRPSPPRFDGNYFYVLHHQGKTVLIDVGCAETFQNILSAKNWQPDAIWITHHHWDHTDGLPSITQQYHCPVYLPATEQAKILPKIQHDNVHLLYEGDQVFIGDQQADIIDLGGHTLGHIAYYFKDLDILFSGDVLFGMGCGRVFEGSYQQAFQSLQKLAQLPDATQVYCAHEYSQTNAEFCRRHTAEGQYPDAALQRHDGMNKYIQQITHKRQQDLPTVPLTLGDEKQFNPFLQDDFQQFERLRNLRNAW